MDPYGEKMKIEYEIAEGLNIKIDILENEYQIPIDQLFVMAARKNPKRSFLFVSKVLGKHIPIEPYKGILANHLLANQYLSKFYGILDEKRRQRLVEAFLKDENAEELYQTLQEGGYSLPEENIFIGFAETATGIGQGVFSCFKNGGYYTHTTRERFLDYEMNVEFKEEHSHATDHNCYGLGLDLLKSKRPIVLVDDEITTGKTIMNIIRELQASYPRTSYAVLSFLDWRSEEHRQAFADLEKELNISIRVISLVSGTIEVEGHLNTALFPEDELGMEPEKTDARVEEIILEDYFLEPINKSIVDEKGNKKIGTYLKETGRFGLSSQDQLSINLKVKEIGQVLREKRVGKRTLCLGTEEFMYLPMAIASHMGAGVKYHSTTRSPIYPVDRHGYGARNGFSFQSLGESGATNYIYNIPKDTYDEVFLILEKQVPIHRLTEIRSIFERQGISKICFVYCTATEQSSFSGSYKSKDVVFLLKDISDLMVETDTEDKEEAIQSGIHYSEMLPVEYKPTARYIELFHVALEESARKMAVATGVVAEKILENRGKEIVLVSLARAGTPMGILIKRYIESTYDIKVPHYSVSIIRGKGIDENAMKYILMRHPGKEIQFVDGWTGKGAITKVLMDSCHKLNEELGSNLKADIAVLSDPGECSSTFGTREDFLIPSACLNATVSGLISRTVHRKDLIGPRDFHGVKFYKELIPEDLSNVLVDRIESEFTFVKDDIREDLLASEKESATITWRGLEDIRKMQEAFSIEDINLIKPGIGETTRVLLRRVPWKILVRDLKDENLKHILLLAQERNVEVEEYTQMTYGCCGLIKDLTE